MPALRGYHTKGRLAQVLAGIDAAEKAGLAIKINMVPMRGTNEDEIEDMLLWAHGRGFALTLIEAMPLGEIDISRTDTHISLKEVGDRLGQRFTLEPLLVRAGGRLAMCGSRKRAVCWASSRRLLTTSAKAATACV